MSVFAVLKQRNVIYMVAVCRVGARPLALVASTVLRRFGRPALAGFTQ